MHRCDNKQCCNPDHIIAGTHAENMADAAKKGLMHPGSQHGMAKLMEAQVLEIRALWKSGEWRQREIAERFGISASSVSTIINRKNWTHI